MFALYFPASMATKCSLRLWLYTNAAGALALTCYFILTAEARGMYVIGIIGGICGALFSAPVLPFLMPAMRWVLIESDGFLRFFRLLAIMIGLIGVALGAAALVLSGFTWLLVWLASPYMLAFSLLTILIYRHWLFRPNGSTIFPADSNA